MNAISGLVITLNEEDHIRDCLQSLFQVCDDVVVVDSNSQDRTAQYARDTGARVLDQKFLGDGPQRSFGAQHCKHDWVFYIDADERVEGDLVRDIQSLDLDDQNIEAYECRRKNYFNGRWVKVAGQYPDYVCRLYNKTKTDFSPLKTHARIEPEN